MVSWVQVKDPMVQRTSHDGTAHILKVCFGGTGTSVVVRVFTAAVVVAVVCCANV